MAEKHPGFAKAAENIMKLQNVSRKSASAILAAGARKASAKAKAKNPRLNKVG